MRKYGTSLLLGCVLVSSLGNAAQPACKTTPLSAAEAQQLLDAMPDAMVAKTRGGNLDAVDWNPGATWRHDLFFFFQLFALNRKDADDGNLGFFAVNKITGRVVDGLIPDQTVTGYALGKLQAKLRTQHCVGEKAMRQYDGIPPYPDH